MPDILHDFPINAAPDQVLRALSDPAVLDEWWTKSSSGKLEIGCAYDLGFGPEYQWRARVSKHVPGREIELTMTKSDADWDGTRVAMHLSAVEGGTQVRFAHTGWPADNAHFRTSSFCWAMYLRVLKRYLEFGERVPYEKRLDV